MNAPAMDKVIGQYHITEKPYYRAIGDEVQTFEAAYAVRMPMMLKGPTGCGKTRFMQYLAWRLKRPLITVSCHDDLSTSDLVGRFLIKGSEAVWIDGPLTMAVKAGGICYLDEIVEARKDTTVVIHPLADDRRELPVEKLGRLFLAEPQFMLAVSYNPGYQSVLKDLKPSTRQRFVSLTFGYPTPEIEKEIVSREGGVDVVLAGKLVKLALMTRGLKESGLPEGASTRLLIQAAQLHSYGIDIGEACRAGITHSLTDDPDMLGAMDEMIASIF